MLLESRHLEMMRENVRRTLPDTAIIYTVQTTSDVWADNGAGGTVSAKGTYAARIDPVRTEINDLRTGKEVMVINHTLTLPYDANVVPGDRARVGAAEYEITSIHATHSWRVAVRCEVNQVF
ncbi:MAG: hypothetical protein OHK0046_48050 [Anaerolineae bacterium]